jgi:hypothetical protein
LVGLLITALGLGGSDPFTTTPLLSLHSRLPKNNNAATKATKKIAPAVLMPAMAPFDKPGGLLSLADADVLVGVDTGRELVVEGVGIELTLDSLVVEVEVDVDVDVDVKVKVNVDVDFDDAVVVSNIAAPLVLLDSFAATMLSLGQPSSLLQALTKQQPMKGVSKLEQVYQLPLPAQD